MRDNASRTADSSVVPFGLDREMGYSRKEFFDQLPHTLSDYEYSINGDEITISLDEGTVLVRVGIEGERRLSAVVCFPKLPVTIRFEGVDEHAQKRFMQRFNSSYMKGLG